MWDGVRIFDGDMQMVFVESRLVFGDYRLSLRDYEKAVSVARASIVEGCVQREQRANASSESGVRTKILMALCLYERRGTGEKKCGLERCYCCFPVR